MNIHARRVLMVLAAGVAFGVQLSSAASRDLGLFADGAFLNYLPTAGVVPIAVDLENKGANAKGVLHVSSEGFDMDYPIELPRGSKKRIFVYPQGGVYSGLGAIDLVLETDQGTKTYRVATQALGLPSSNPVALISDVAGDLGFFRQRDVSKKNTYGESNSLNDVYAKPDRAPTRPIGYDGLQGIVLGSGSERLSDEAVKAIRVWAMTGGTLIFVGGASTAALSDPRWREVLPIDGVTLTTVKGSNVLKRLGGVEMPDEISLAVPKPAQGASLQRDGNMPILVQRPYGMGRVVYMACNPFEAPLNRWPGRKMLFSSQVKSSQWSMTRAYLEQFQVNNSPYQYGGVAYSTAGTSAGGGYYAESPEENDPFSTTLPPTSRVFTLLVAYFIVVVPINFIILRKVKKGEWAWVTSPLISLAFAGAFLSSAGDLYAAKLSRATRGLLVAREGDDTGMFVGKTEMFFPQGGSYDLGIKAADSVGMANPREDWRGLEQDESMEDLHARDEGTVKVDQMSVNNLTFRQISYRELVPVARWFTFDVKPTGRGTYVVTIRNNSSRRLTHASLVAGGQSMSIPDIPSGQNAHVEVRGQWTGVDEQYDRYYGYGGSMAMSAVTGLNGSIAVVGDMNDLPVGPQIGKNFPARTSIRMAFFAAAGIPKGAQ